MCGIAGIIHTGSSRFGQEQLVSMSDALSHRGPDGFGYWRNPGGEVLLGHRRLSILDLSDAASQPMHFRNRYTIIHNGEIYNYQELREELQKKGYSFKTQSDTEVILAAYDHWEAECVDHFNGMFAFAIWDEELQELFAARDRFGEKPFYYFFDGQHFIFASEMKAIWAAGIERQANLQLLFNFLTIGYVDNPERPEETFYSTINKLPPASLLYYNPASKELSVEKYWDLDIAAVNKKITDAEAMDKFNSLFTESVRKRLRSDVSIGTSLSGGLDSSSIAAIAAGLGADHFLPQAFTAIFPGFEKDESVFSKEVADSFHLEQFTTAVTADDLLKNWGKLCYHQEEPFGSASVFPQFKVYELAKQNHTNVLLDGQGADEVLAGYSKYYKWYWQELFVKQKLVSSGEIKAAKRIGVQESFTAKNIMAALFPDFASVILERQYLLKALRQEDLNRDFIKLQSKEAYYSTPSHFNLNGALYFNTCMHGLEELLRYADRNAMAHGCEVRLPFLDHELVEFVFSLPSHFKIRQGWTKWLLRTSMNEKLPASIAWRKDKVGFEPPQQQWMQDKKVQELIHEAKKKMVNDKILKPDVLTKSILPLGSTAADNYDWRYLSAAAFI